MLQISRQEMNQISEFSDRVRTATISSQESANKWPQALAEHLPFREIAQEPVSCAINLTGEQEYWRTC